MIRVGVGKPRIWYSPASNDMSHFTPAHFETNSYYYLDLNEYMEKLEFDRFDMQPNLTPRDVENIMKGIDFNDPLSAFLHPWVFELNRLIGKAGGQLWQFNAVDRTLEGYVRDVIFLGGKQLRRWSWFDAQVKLPILEFTARVLNRLFSNRMARQVAVWEKRLDQIYSGKKAS